MPFRKHYLAASLIIIAIDSANQGKWKMKLKAFEKMIDWIGARERNETVTVVLKSTNVLGFADRVQKMIDRTPSAKKIRLLVNPEFLREGHAYEDTAHPWRIVIGARRTSDAATLHRLYRFLHGNKIPIVKTDWRGAELIKLASNLYLSHRLAYVNEVAGYCRTNRLDLDSVLEGIRLDPRIGDHYFQPGLGFGGSCLPKDCHLINSREGPSRFEFGSATNALRSNEKVLDRVIDALRGKLGDIRHRKIAILGATFKPETDDVRGSRAVALALKLKRRGVRVSIYEPNLPASSVISEGNLPVEENLERCLKQSSAIIVGTAHRRFARLNANLAAKLVKRRLVCDYFSILNKKRWEKAGFEFV